MEAFNGGVDAIELTIALPLRLRESVPPKLEQPRILNLAGGHETLPLQMLLVPV
jgi:hypothetical protein